MIPEHIKYDKTIPEEEIYDIVNAEYHKIILYGDSGSNKTTIAMTAPHPLIVTCEKGAEKVYKKLLELKVATDIDQKTDIVNIYSMKAMRVLMGTISSWFVPVAQNTWSGEMYYKKKEGINYDTIIIDSITEFNNYARDESLLVDDVKRPMSSAPETIPGMNDHSYALQVTRNIIRKLRDMPINVIMIALAEHNDDRQIFPQIGGKLTAQAMGYFDECWFVVKHNDDGYEYSRATIITDTWKGATCKTRGSVPRFIDPKDGRYEPDMRDIFKMLNVQGEQNDE